MTEQAKKQWWKSKTIAANIGAIVAIALAAKGIPTDPALVTGVILNIASVVGRLVAKQKLDTPFSK